MKLEQYFEAYDNTHTLAGKSPEWSVMRRRIRWSLARPALELAGQVAFVLGCLALGWWGSPIGYLLALGVLCFMPQHRFALPWELSHPAAECDPSHLIQHFHTGAGPITGRDMTCIAMRQ